MSNRQITKLVHEGEYVAEITVELIETDGEWAPYLSIDDAYKLDNARAALRQHDTNTAAKYGTVYRLTPV